MRTHRSLRAYRVMLLAAAALVGFSRPSPSPADVVILKDGTRLEGIATTSSLIPNIVLFSDHVNESIRLPRNKVQSIIREPEAVSRLRIGRALARQGKYEEALEQLRQAKRQAPNDPAVLDEERAVLDALAAKQAEQAEIKTKEARDLLDKIKEAMDKKQFEKATVWFAMLADETVPPDVHREALQLRIKFYEAWGDDKLDKTDTFGAMECYEEVLGMDPENKQVYPKLMRLYEKVYRPGAGGTDDAKRVQRLQDYLEAKVENDPGDLASRLRLANLLYMRHDWERALEQYRVAYKDLNTTGSANQALPRVQGRLFSLLDRRHRELAKQHDYDGAIKQFRELQSFFPDVDTEPLYRYEYWKRTQALKPGDVEGRLQLVRFCKQYGLESEANKELFTVLREEPKNAEALKILETWARRDLAEIESAFNSGLYAQIQGLVTQLHTKYPVDKFPSLEAIHSAADDFVERARNEARAIKRQKGKRAQELARSGDENFDRAMAALHAYREGAGTNYGRYRSSNRDYTTTVGSYKAEAISYFERALRYYREALALDPSLADPAKGDLRRKTADCQRYLTMLKSKRIRRVRPGPRSSRRFSTPTRNRYRNRYNPYYYPYYPYPYPYVQPVVPYPYPPGLPSPYPNPYQRNPYGNRVRP